MSTNVNEFKLTVVLLGLVLGVALCVWVLGSWAEASAYNRVTGRSVSTWDAMFLELRVDG